MLLPPHPGGFLPKEVLAIDKKIFSPPVQFSLPDDPETLPWSWKNQGGSERFMVGDYAIFKSNSVDAACMRVNIKNEPPLFIGRIVKFCREKAGKSVYVHLNPMLRDLSHIDDRIISRSKTNIIGEAEDMIVRKAVVLSSKAFANLKYCQAASAKCDPDPYMFCMSQEYEDWDGLVKWTKPDESSEWQDELHTVFYDDGRECAGREECEWWDDDAQYGGGQEVCSQDY